MNVFTPHPHRAILIMVDHGCDRLLHPVPAQNPSEACGEVPGPVPLTGAFPPKFLSILSS